MTGGEHIDAAPPWEEFPDNVFAMPGVDFEPVPEAGDDPLPGVADPSEWAGHKAPERRFIIPGWLVRGHAGLLSGMEGVGKSLIAQQMMTCAAIGRPFLGLDVVHVNAVYITCEDSQDELWRRQEGINAALGITMEDIAGKLLLVSLCGELGNELGTFDREGRITPSLRYRQIEKLCIDFKAGLAVLDNAAHLFPGNEIVRHDVAAFLSLLERLSQIMDGAVLLLAHPNKQHSQGSKQGNEYSGSTGWSAHVRNRFFLDYRDDKEDGTAVDDDERVLRKSKANYGKRGEEIYFRWHEWAFVRLEDMGDDQGREIAANAQANAENAMFLECLDKATSERRPTSASPAASNFAPRVFAKMTTARGMGMKSFEAAMNRLLHLDEITGDKQLFQRSNRTWATGLGRSENCTKPCTNHAQSGAQSVHKAAQSYTTPVHPADTPSTTYIGTPLEGVPDTYVPAGEDWMDEVPPIGSTIFDSLGE